MDRPFTKDDMQKQSQEKMVNIISHEKMQVKTTLRSHFHTFQNN